MNTIAKRYLPAFLLSLVSVGAFAQVASSPFEDLANALNPPSTDESAFDRLMDESLRGPLADDPDIRSLENVCPGSLDAMLNGGRPRLKEGFLRDQNRYRAEMAALFAKNLSPEHAAEVAAIYSSPLGQRLVRAVEESQSIDSVMAEAMADPDGVTSEDAIARDNARTMLKAAGSLTPADNLELSKLFAESEGFSAFISIQDEMDAIRMRIDLESANEEDPELDEAMATALDEHLDKCPALND